MSGDSINVGVGGGGVGAAGGGSGSGSGGGGCGPCGACKFLRRKCVSGCIFAPYFDSEQGAVHFAAVHKVFGASNVSKLLLHIPTHKRLDAVITICYEANARLREPVYGCVAHIFALQQQVANLQAELSYMRAHLATLELPSPPLLPPPSPPPFSVSELPSASSLPAVSFDIATLLEAPADAPWSVQQQLEEQQQMELRQLGARGAGGLTEGTSASGDLRALARELVDEYRSDSVDPPPPVSK